MNLKVDVLTPGSPDSLPEVGGFLNKTLNLKFAACPQHFI